MKEADRAWVAWVMLCGIAILSGGACFWRGVSVVRAGAQLERLVREEDQRRRESEVASDSLIVANGERDRAGGAFVQIEANWKAQAQEVTDLEARVEMLGQYRSKVEEARETLRKIRAAP